MGLVSPEICPYLENCQAKMHGLMRPDQSVITVSESLWPIHLVDKWGRKVIQRQRDSRRSLIIAKGVENQDRRERNRVRWMVAVVGYLDSET